MSFYEEQTARFVCVVDAMVEALTTHGPLNHVAVYYFADSFLVRDGGSPISESDYEPSLTLALGMADGYPARIIFNEAEQLYKLVSDPRAVQRVPAPEHFVRGFYRLYERYEALLERHPEDRLPAEVMDSLYGEL